MKEKENLTIDKVEGILKDIYSILSKNSDILDSININFKENANQVNKFIFYYNETDISKLTLYLNPDMPNSIKLKYSSPIVELLGEDAVLNSALKSIANKDRTFFDNIMFTLEQTDYKGRQLNLDIFSNLIKIPNYKETVLEMLRMILDQMDNKRSNYYANLEHVILCFGINTVKLEIHARVNGHPSYQEFKLSI